MLSELKKRSSIIAVMMMCFFTFVFLGLEYHFVNMIALSADEHSTVGAQNYTLGVSAAGFLLYPLFSRFLKKRGQQICTVLASLAAAACILIIELRISYASTLAAGLAAFLILGLFCGAVFCLSAAAIETDRYLASHVGVAYALSVLLQFINNNLIDSDPIESLVLAVFLLALAALLIVSQNTLTPEGSASVKRADGGEKKPFISNETVCGLLLILLVALMACIFSTLDNAVTIEHASGKTDIGRWPRMLLSLSGLAAGFIFDIGGRKHMNLIMYCVMLLSAACVAVLQLGGPFIIGLIIFYLSSGFFVVFFTVSFMELSFYMRLPELWAGMGRAVNNICASLITVGSLFLVSSDNGITEIILALVLFAAVSVVMAAYISKKQAITDKLDQRAGEDMMHRDRLQALADKYSFTPREREVFDRLVNTEDSIQQIAESLYISRRTCQRHITAIYEKVGVKSRMGLYQLYAENRPLEHT